MPQVAVRGGEDIIRAANRLREVDRKLPTKLRKELRDSVKPTVQKLKRRVRALDASGEHGSTGLRRRVARGIRVRAKARTGAIRIVTAMPEKNEAVIPRGLDSYTRHVGWRHPVFGNRNVWVTQPGHDWFVSTISGDADQITRGITSVLDKAENFLAGRGSF